MWTYDPTNLSQATEEGRKNIVRLLVGDTDESDPQLQDEEIIFALSSNRDKVYTAGVFVVNAILSRYARLVNVELDEAIREDYSDLIKNYNEIRNELLAKSKSGSGGIRIIATGLTGLDFETADTDPNRVKPGIRQHEWESDRYGISNEGYITVTETPRT